jgi:hypothetical protein
VPKQWHESMTTVTKKWVHSSAGCRQNQHNLEHCYEEIKRNTGFKESMKIFKRMIRRNIKRLKPNVGETNMIDGS